MNVHRIRPVVGVGTCLVLAVGALSAPARDRALAAETSTPADGATAQASLVTVPLEPFVAVQQAELPHDVVVQMDGAGGAQILWRGDPVAQVDLVLEGGRMDDPESWSEHDLSVREGARIPDPALLDLQLAEGEDGGRRGPTAAGDDDGDGRIDEDPVDGLDDDGDGRIDEDYAAIGFQMRVSRATLDTVGLPGVELRPQTYQWPYFHVDDVLFWDTGLAVADDVQVSAAPAVRLRACCAIAVLDTPLRPHVSAGRAALRRLRMPYVRVDGRDGARLYVGLLRLDGLGAEILPDRSGIIWNAGATVHWPLALVTAPTFDVLLYDAGQALLTYARPGETGSSAPVWAVPPICARCQRADVDRVALRLGEDGSDLLLNVELDGLDPHIAVSHEGLAIGGGHDLGRYLIRESERSASYRVPRDTAAGHDLLAAARRGSLDVDVMLHSGLTVRPHTVDLDTDPELVAEVGRELQASEEFLPGHLSPDLLETWPNPFQQSTTIRYRIPSTLGESFDFEGVNTGAIDLAGPAPFGTSPMVRVKVYNVGGQLIRLLDQEVRTAGEYSVSWDGSDEQGRPVAAGAYYVNVEVGDYTVTRRVLRLKP